ncbi:glycosyltransferase family protein [Microvirga alba]|uniref:Glycosyltransferase n=1 Tax=Microvirga alba TaxID=2791025 RepID=A0A931BLE7_9HYPH|nr:glycosyltransferase [Microvirga alba]MBF9231988.1 glycosyltransferase [Microvirga alba]
MPVGRGSSNPVLGQRFGRKSSLRLLLVGFFDPNGLLTIRENIAALQWMSRHTIDVANMWPGGSEWLAFPSTFDPRDYHGIIFHPTVSYHPNNIAGIDRKIALKLRDYRGLKILMKQDEQFRSGRFAEIIDDKKFDLLVTCLAPSEWEKVYPRRIIGDCRILQSLTGFVSSEMRSDFWREPATGRPIDVSYRGSLQPLSFGHLGLEKREIGEKFLKQVERSGITLRCDISSRWEDRHFGQDWIGFLQNSRATLGVESGSNLFDFDGRVEQECARFAEQNRDMDPWSDAYYQKAHAEFLHKYEGNVFYNQLSPRHFEAAATGAVQILYEGTYSDVFEPWRHFIPLKKDFSNFAEVVDTVRDDVRLRELATNAYEDIILNPKYTYQQFVREIDAMIEQIASEKSVVRSKAASGGPLQTSEKPVLFILASHDPVLDPRIGWWAEKLVEFATVVEVGFHRHAGKTTGCELENVADGHLRLRIDPEQQGDSWLRFVDDEGRVEQNAGLSVLKNLMLAAMIKDDHLNSRFGLLGGAEDRFRFRSHLNYYVSINSNLIEVCQKLGSPSAIIACDLDTLPAGVALAGGWDIPLIYDAHEFWPFSFPGALAGESSFWEAVERTLIPSTDLRICVSPQLSNVMAEAYGHPFETVPNAVPTRDAKEVRSNPKVPVRKDQVEFLYQGIFAPTRGIDLLIKVWRKTSSRCVLVLRGPDGSYKDQMRDLAAREGVLGGRVIFGEPVAEDQLIAAASRSDVGIIPYEPANINNKFCCPNKLSQYMAAGLPILANRTDFVRNVLDESGGGTCVDFTNEEALIETINRLAEDDGDRMRMADKAHAFFAEKFNWDVVSAGAVASVKSLVADACSTTPTLDLSWIVSTPPVQPDTAHEALIPETVVLPEIITNFVLSLLNATNGQPVDAERLSKLWPVLGEQWAQRVKDLEQELKRGQGVEVALQGEIQRLQECVRELAQIAEAYDNLNMRPSQLLSRLGAIAREEVRKRVKPAKGD